jgi:hypothetical protein
MFARGLIIEIKASATTSIDKNTILIEPRLITVLSSVSPNPAGTARQNKDKNCHLSGRVPKLKGSLKNPIDNSASPLILKTKLNLFPHLFEKKARQPISEKVQNKI